MPATTDKLAIPYPLPTEKVADFPTTAKQAAERMEAILTAPETKPSAIGNSWVVRRGSGIFEKAGNVITAEPFAIGAPNGWTVPAGFYDDIGRIVPVGWEPPIELSYPTVCQSSTVYAHGVIGIRVDGTLWTKMSTSVKFNAADIWNFLAIPPLRWRVAA